jgi:hypothetical protein
LPALVVDQDTAEGLGASGSRVSRSERRSMSVTDHRPKGQPTLPVPEQTVKTRAINATNTIAIAISHSFLTIGPSLARCGHECLRPRPLPNRGVHPSTTSTGDTRSRGRRFSVDRVRVGMLIPPASTMVERLHDPQGRNSGVEWEPLTETGFAFPPVALGSPNGVRTRVSTLRGWCPRPLDDGTAPSWWAGAHDTNGHAPGSSLWSCRAVSTYPSDS